MGARDADEVSVWPNGNLVALAAAAASARPDAEALVDGRRRLTWAELVRECTAVGHGLADRGLVAGHRVAILLGNRAEFVTAYLGALGAGLVAVPLNPASATGEIVRVLADSQARLVVCEPATATSARAAVAGLADALEGADEELRSRTVVPQVVLVDGPVAPGERSYADLAGAGGAPLVSPRDPETLAVLLYTSGTGGRPRAAMLPHRALLANVEQAASLTPPPVGDDDRVLAVLPLFHAYGLNAVLGQVLRQQACVVLAERFDTEGTLALIARERVTNVPVAPSALAAWVRRDDLGRRFGGVRTVLCGASPLAAEVAQRFEAATGRVVHQEYGMTEAAPVITTTLGTARPSKRGSVGRALPGVQLRVVDEGGRDTENGDPGEVWVRGHNLFCGYWPDGAGAPGPHGWYATGDVGYLDADGDLFLVDRLQEVVNVSGFNVYPVEVEKVIDEVEDVGEVAVVGVADTEGVEQVVAYVVAGPDAGADAGMSPQRLADQVRAHCERRLAPFKRPGHVRVVDELPRSVSGKVAKGRLRDTAGRRAMGLS